MNRGASFTYRGVGFDTADGRSGFIAANDGSGTVPAKNVIIAGGTAQEHSGDWLEFSPDDAIALAEGIIDAAEHAKSGGVGAGCWNPEDPRDYQLLATAADSFNRMGKCVGPRSELLVDQVVGPTAVIRVTRSTSSRSTACASMRARGAPTHICAP
jgi:hypothetical protein